ELAVARRLGVLRLDGSGRPQGHRRGDRQCAGGANGALHGFPSQSGHGARSRPRQTTLGAGGPTTPSSGRTGRTILFQNLVRTFFTQPVTGPDIRRPDASPRGSPG